jgi:O-antigen/teichoic acid export membrane protein
LVKQLLIKIRNPLFLNSLFVLTGNVLAQGMNFITLIILARYFGPEQIALYTTSLILLTLLLSLADSGLSNSVVNLINRKGISSQTETNKYLKAGLSIRLGLGIFISLTGFFFAKYLSIDIYHNPALRELFIFAFLGVTILGLHSYISTIYQTKNNFIRRTKYQISTSVIRVLGLLIMFIISEHFSIKNAFIIYVFSPLLVMIFHFKEIITIVKQPLSIADFKLKSKTIFNFSKWLFLSMIAVLLISRIDQFMLLKMVPPEEAGYYAIATQLIMILPLITESLTTVLLPKVSNLNTDLQKYRQQILKRIGPISIFILILIPIAKYLILIIFGNSYAPAIPIFQILVIGFSLDITINLLSLVFYSTSKVWYLTILNYIQLITVIIGNIILIPHFHSVGAAVSATLVRVIALGYILIFSGRILKSKLNSNI